MIRKIRQSRRKIALVSLFTLITLIPVAIFLMRSGNLAEAAWWQGGEEGNWLKRKRLTLVNNSGANLSTGATVAVTVNTADLVRRGVVREDCSDLRVLYQPNSSTADSLLRYLDYPGGTTCQTSENTRVYFKLQAGLNNGANSPDYYLYYTNSQAEEPEGGAFDLESTGALLVCPFEGSETCTTGTAQVSGAVRYGGEKSALSFDGVNDDINLGRPYINYGNQATWEFWAAPTLQEDQYLIDSTHWSNFQIRAYFASGVLYIRIHNGQGTIQINIGSPWTYITAGQWNHVAIVLDGENGTNVYINGVSRGTGSALNGNLDNISNQYDLFIGKRVGSETDYYRGIIDEVRISDIARYTSNFTPQSTPFVRDENTVLLYHFDENGDDPRNTGKAIDDSGNNFHGTITGAKYVTGVVGVDSGQAGVTSEGKVLSQSFASHAGLFIEEGTTNKVTNPSFEADPYDTDWEAVTAGAIDSQYQSLLAKRSPPGPFAAAPLTQTGDIISLPRGDLVEADFYSHFDPVQGSTVLWWTPEYDSADTTITGVKYIWYISSSYYFGFDYGNDQFLLRVGGQNLTVPADIYSGTTYGLVARWDSKEPISGANYAGLSINDTHNFGVTTKPTVSAPSATIYLGSNNGDNGSSGLIEYFSVYRRVLYDGSVGINLNGLDEVAAIKASGGSDPTLITGSWDVVLAVPTNGGTGTLTSGAGEAWSQPHGDNLLGEGGFMLGGDFDADGWASSATASSSVTLDSTGNVGGQNSISLGPDGLPRIAYLDYTNLDLKYIRCTNSTCSTKVTTTIESTGTVGLQPSIGIGADGYAQIAYYNGSTGELRFAHCTNADCTSFNARNIENTGLRSANEWYWSRAIKLQMGSDGYARIAYYDQNSSHLLRYAVCNDADCSSPTLSTVNDTTGRPGAWLDLVLDSSNNPYLTYHHGRKPGYTGGWGYGALDYARYVGSGGTGCSNAAWQCTLIYHRAGWAPAIALGSDGYPIIWHSYHSPTARSDVFKCNDINCSSVTMTQLQTTEYAYPNSAIITGGQYPEIVTRYRASGVYYFRHFKCSNASCTSFTYDTLETNADGINAVRTDSGAIYASFQQTVDLDLKLMMIGLLDVEDIGDTDKIYGGGYAVTNVAADEGIYKDITVAAGDDVVVRAVASSDGTCQPRVVLHDQTGDSQISSLTGTTTSTKNSPDILLFSAEVPSGSTTVRVKLINGADTGTCSWHQAEVYPNLITNPSMETGSGDTDGNPNPWIPTGWSNYLLDTGESQRSSSVKRSGSYSLYLNASEQQEGLKADLGGTVNKFYSLGIFGYEGTSQASFEVNPNGLVPQSGGDAYQSINTGSNWKPSFFVARVSDTGNDEIILNGRNGAYSGYFDDAYALVLNDVSLSVTPAGGQNLGGSYTVNGADTYVTQVADLTTTGGTLAFSYTPNRSAAQAVALGNSPAYLFEAYGDSNDYIRLYFSAANTLTLAYSIDGTTAFDTWDATGAITAHTAYDFELTYTGSGSMVLSVDTTARITLTSIPAAFGEAPDSVYLGSSQAGAYQADGEFLLDLSSFSVDPITSEVNTGAAYIKFGAKSNKLTNNTGGNRVYATDLNAGNTNQHTLSAYVYRATTGNVGGTVDGTVAWLVFSGTEQTTSYTDMGGGWWRLTFSAAASGDQIETYGVAVADGETVYLDGVQLEEKAIATSYADGSLGEGYTWSGEAHASESTRAVSGVEVPLAEVSLSASTGSVSFWFRPNWAGNDNRRYDLFSVETTAGELRLFKDTDNSLKLTDGVNTALIAVSWVAGSWQQIAADWGSSNMHVYLNGQAGTAAGAYTAPTFDSGGSVFIGQSTGNSYQANGLVSDFRLYDGIITTGQIGDIYRAGLVSYLSGYEVDWFSPERGQNPLAVWHFDEGYGQRAHDSTLNGHHLDLNGPTWRVSLGGGDSRLLRSLSFDGVDDQAVLPANQARSFNFGTGSFTLSGWFRRPQAATGVGTILSKYGDAGYQVYLDAEGKVCFGIDDDSSWGPDDAACSDLSYGDNAWHHFEAVRAADKITLYIDGLEMAVDDTLAASGSLSNNANLVIGADNTGANFFTGNLDEFIIYPYARSVEQVKTDFAGGQTAIYFGANQNDFLSDGLVGYWKMDEASWNGTSGEAKDSSGNGNHGTAVNGANTAVGKYGRSGSFDGNNDEMLVMDPPHLDGMGELTISSWVFVDDAPTDAYWLIQKLGTGNSYAIKFTSAGLATFNVATTNNAWDTLGTVVSTNTALDYGKWYFLTGVYNGKDLKIYVDGNLSNTTSDNISGVIANSSHLRFGYRSPSATDYFDGKLDESRIYNRALSPAEVKSLYQWAPGPVSYHSLDEGTGTVAQDRSGNNHTGTLTNTASSDWVEGKFGKGVQLNGSDQYIDIGTGPGTVNTVSFWVKPNSTTAHLIDLNGSAYISASSGTISATGFTTPTYFVNGVQTATPTLTANVWQHISVTTATPLNASDYDIGRVEGSGFLSGVIDEVKLYNYARSAQQIVSDMNAGHPAPGSPIGSPLLHFKFDEQQGQVVNNSGNQGSAFNGTLGADSSLASDDPSWKTDVSGECKFNGCLSFDGALNFVEIPDVTLTGAWTISTWAQPLNAASFQGLVGSSSPGSPYINLESDQFHYNYGSGNNRYTTFTQDLNWHHYLITCDSSSNCKVYIDGVLRDSYVGGGMEIDEIGRFWASSDYTYQGLIDEFKAFNFSMSEDQVLMEFNAGAAVNFGAGADSEASTLNDGAGNPPVGYWNLDEQTGGAANDKSGNNRTGTLTNSPTWENSGSCKSGPCLSFNGSNQYIDIGTGPTTVRTVSFWAYPRSTTTYFINLTGTSDYIWLNNGTVTATGFSTPTIYVDGQVTSTMVVNKWQHVTVTSATAENASNLDIGRTQDANYMNGMIDEVKLYDYVRTRSQIMYDFNRGGPIGHWKFDECSGTVANDVSGFGKHGTIIPGAGTYTSVGTCGGNALTQMWAAGSSGKYGGSLGFDGDDDYVNAGNTGLSVNSVAFWVKPTTTTEYFVNLTGTSDYVWSNAGTLTATGFSTPAIYINGKTGTTLTAGQWQHVVVTSATAETASNLTFGRTQDTNYFEGQLDDLRLYNYALSPLQILNIYNSGAVYFGP